MRSRSRIPEIIVAWFLFKAVPVLFWFGLACLIYFTGAGPPR